MNSISLLRMVIMLIVMLLVTACDEDPQLRTPRPTQATVDYGTRLATIYDGHDGVASVEMATVRETDTGWLVYAEVTMYEGWNSLGMAQELQQLALALLVSSRVDFSVILTDNEHGAVDYSRWTYADDWIVTAVNFNNP